MLYSQIALSISLVIIWNILSTKGDCIPLNGVCTKTIFAPCCNNTVCKLSGPFSGKCVECLKPFSWCWNGDECCSKQCSWFRCLSTVEQ
ncbi:unnamed protein product [Schistosoma margrebowiei]|uniref:UPF0506 domain-containing protein n=2 Tax=Schistosoma TaxID=6181 RepID=A0AA85ALF7_9TREM|nr:unnamed protein product [Schistosoma mattheei]CAH8607328.1 unnamed protein product [Schistosoma curassoni]CAH8607923.1 unnamed protein product [Schistosoma margrebowiei]CAH8617794.1 unnamed protein product [Schistosoma haematobium]CAH8625628.1 unnamed protein product [Schistosoma haematobium]